MLKGPHQELTGKILKCAFAVHNELGPGFLEKVYENALVLEMRRAGIQVLQQLPVVITYKGQVVGEGQLDLLAENAVLIEGKATERTPPVYIAQVLNYLEATGHVVGLLLNFGQVKLQYRRLTLRAGMPHVAWPAEAEEAESEAQA
jgi:GxxExxY protein